MATWLFCISVVALVYVYAGFPALLAVFAKRWGHPHTTDTHYTPSVTILVAAHQEARVIRAKLENFLEIDYPHSLLRMLIVSDGSTDGTDEIIENFTCERVTLLRQEPRQGKAAALNLGLDAISSDVVVLTDANVMFESSAVRELVKNLADGNVGVVTGDVILLDEKLGYAASEGAYYKYERFIQANESRLWSVVGVDGALYAAKRELIVAPPVEAILDDFVLSMTIACNGHRIVYEPAARAYEDAPPAMDDEFRRKTRTSAGAFQALTAGWALPTRGARLMFCFFSHKVMRWAAPWFMLVAFVCNVLLAPGSAFWTVLLAAHASFYLLAVAGLKSPSLRRFKVVSIPMYFVLMNAAVGRGLIRHLSGRSSAQWTPTARTQIDSSLSGR